MQPNINLADKNTREYMEKQTASGRYALLITAVFTAVNLLLVLMNTGRYIVYSASIPYYMTSLAKAMDSYYGTTYLAEAAPLACLITALYFLLWLLSRRASKWLLPALVLFSVDTAVLLYAAFFMMSNPMNCVLDLFLHGWVIWQLLQGYRCGKRLQAVDG